MLKVRCLQRLYSRFMWARWLYGQNGGSTIAAAHKTFDHEFKSNSIGSRVEGFVVDCIEDVPELHLSAIQFTHEKTKAKYLHVAKDDSNNVFSIGFRTTPMDSTGVPHILEHTTLCGSQKYSCRDPFFKMLNRSLSTFMNAMTGPDYTIYPFSTQNQKDFEHLMSVYLDAVFRPKLRELDFLQEGWRLEHADVNDSKTPIVIKGVVFNEMKGVFSDPQQLFGQRLLSGVLPSHTYGFVSGGDPDKIPDLTWEGLKNFHDRYYHPTNARFYSYGNFDVRRHLKFINDNYLSSYDYSPIDSTVPRQTRWTEVQRKHVECRYDPMSPDASKQGTLAISYLLGDNTDPYENFVLQVLSELLIDGPNAPFYKSLIEPNFGCGFSPVTGFDFHTRDTIFTIALQGMSENDFDKVIGVIEDTLEKVAAEGFDRDRIEAVLHRVELAVKHQSSNFGLGLLMGLVPVWNHDGNAIDALHIARAVERFRKALKDPQFFQKLVKRHLLSNRHRLVMTMLPSENFENDLKNSERQVLQDKVCRLSEADKTAILRKGKELSEEQSKHDDTSCLPMLHVSDLKPDVERTSVMEIHVDGVPLHLSVQPTNDMTYFRGILNTSHLSREYKELLPLFCAVGTKMGTARYTFREMDNLVSLKTGGLEFKPHVAESIEDVSSYEEGIQFSSYCLNRNMPDMFSLWKELLTNVTFQDRQRFETLVRETAMDLVNGLTHMGHHYCISSASSMLSPSAALKESFHGLSYVSRLKEISQMENIDEVMQIMSDVGKAVLNKCHLRCAVNLSPGSETQALKAMEDFMADVPGVVGDGFVKTKASDFKPDCQKIHYVLPISVNFTCSALPTVPFTHPDFARLHVLAKLLGSQYLHPEIREKGGAYGSGASVGMGGVFSFYSYRDPNRSATFGTFERAFDWLSLEAFTDQHVEEAKLRVFQEIDMPVAPGSRGMKLFLNGISDDLLQAHRLALFKVDREDLLHMGEKFLKQKKRVAKVCIGPDEEGKQNNTWRTVTL